MKIELAAGAGFCFGVTNAVEKAEKVAAADTYSLGEIIHNEIIVNRLESKGLKVVDSVDDVPVGATLVIRSHGTGRETYRAAEEKGLKIVDATCPYVKHIHEIVSERYSGGSQIVIIGKAEHPEVMGIKGWCDQNAVVIDENGDFSEVDWNKNPCIVVQTTFSVQKYRQILKKIPKQYLKTVEIFDTICYTTIKRQTEAEKLAARSDVMLVLGSRTSSNTMRLYEVCKTACSDTYLIESVADLNFLKVKPDSSVGITAGASTPKELIMEVKEYMENNIDEIQSQEFKDAIDKESHVSYSVGKRVKGTVISADPEGVHVNIGGKKDGLVRAEDVNIDGTYDPAAFEPGAEIEAIVVSSKDDNSGCILLSKKKVDVIKEGDKFVDGIRNGEVFELKVNRDTKGGLLGKIGTYTIFVPSSLIREKGSYVRNLADYVGKTLRVVALEIDDDKHKIVASQQAVLMAERKEREEIFWTHVQPNVVVSGVVKRVTDFGAFVSVDGFDCLAHIADLSWTHIKKVEDVLEIGKTYDFLVLKVDREKNRVSLGYKQLQKHPFVACMEAHPIGSVAHGKVTSVVPFGAFVEIEPGIEGLVHVSEAAHTFVKNIADVVKVGDEVDVMIMNYDEANRKITLSIKACTPEEAPAPVEKKEEKRSKSSKPRVETESSEWSEEMSNNPFADLLKDIDVNENK